MSTANSLRVLLDDIKAENLVVYNESTYTVKEINLGAGQRFEITYEVGDDEILSAKFFNHGEELELDSDELTILGTRF